MFFTTYDCIVGYLVVGVTTTLLWNGLTVSFYDHWLRSCRQLRCYFVFSSVWRVVLSSSLYYLELQEYSLIIFARFVTYKVYEEKLVPTHTMKSCVVSRTMASLLCKLFTRYWWTVGFTPVVYWIGGWVGPRDGLGVFFWGGGRKESPLPLPGIEPAIAPSSSP